MFVGYSLNNLLIDNKSLDEEDSIVYHSRLMTINFYFSSQLWQVAEELISS